MRKKLIVVSVAIALFSCVAWSERVVFLYSTGQTDAIDSTHPGKQALPAYPTETHAKAGGITFNVYYDDVDQHRNYGFDDPTYGAMRRARVAEVLDYINTVIDHTGLCDIQFVASESDGAGSLSMAGAGYLPDTPGFTNGIAFVHITTGVDQVPAYPDIQILFDFGWPWYQDAGTPPHGGIDFKSAVLQDVTRGLGLTSLALADGSSRIGPNVYSRWDGFLMTGHGKVLFGFAPPVFLGAVTDLVGSDGGVFFNGPHAADRFGSLPPIFAPDPFVFDSSLAHWNTGEKIAGNAVMEPFLTAEEVIRRYAPVDIGALEDIGYTLTDDAGAFAFSALPSGGWFEVGDALTMTVDVVRAMGTVTYQWTLNGLDLPMGTLATLSIPSLTLDDSGLYTCRATDQSKVVIETPAAWVAVFPADSLPVLGGAGLALAGALCGLAGMGLLRRKN